MRRTAARSAALFAIAALTVVGPSATAATARCAGGRATIVGTEDADQIRGTRDADVILGLGGDDVIFGLRGDDRICGGDGNDRLVGGRGMDRLRGNAGNDVAQAGPGFDWLFGDVGDDALDGGAGLALLDYRAAPGPVLIDLGAGTAGGWGSDAVAGIATVWGSAFDDVLTGSDRAPDETVSYLLEGFVGMAGDDTMSGLAGPDFFQGGEGNDAMDGGDGGDEIDPGPGDDSIVGGPGYDRVSFWGSPQAVAVDLSAGTVTGDGSDTIATIEEVFGSPFGDTITGDGQANELYGDAGSQGCFIDGEPCPFGDDVIHGGGGTDFVAGGPGDDQLFGDDGDDRVDGWDGDDHLDGGAGTDDLAAGDGTDTCVNGETVTECEG